MGGPPKQMSDFYFNFWSLAPHICFWVHHNGKGAPSRAKICNFQKLAWNSPENGNAWTKCLPHHFGGCFTRFLESVLRFRHWKCHFFGISKWLFCPSVRYNEDKDVNLVLSMISYHDHVNLFYLRSCTLSIFTFLQIRFGLSFQGITLSLPLLLQCCSCNITLVWLQDK